MTWDQSFGMAETVRCYYCNEVMRTVPNLSDEHECLNKACSRNSKACSRKIMKARLTKSARKRTVKENNIAIIQVLSKAIQDLEAVNTEEDLEGSQSE